ncbi:MAG: hypothetical protein L6R41_007895, partial [Letrouitia leprolyta]
MSLIGKILQQNPRSYTKLDDLIEIGQNLTKAPGLAKTQDPNPQRRTSQASGLGRQLTDSSRRITSMAIEAALAENDFDTAYSYVVNRFSPSISTQDYNEANTSNQTEREDDISWRAAYLAGRSSSTPSSSSTSPSSIHHLTQRLELLSLSLTLAPSTHLLEILDVWRSVEADLAAISAKEAAEEDRWNSKADIRGTGSGVPGGFSSLSSYEIQESDRKANEKRKRERMEGGNNNNEEAPMGLFEVARGA